MCCLTAKLTALLICFSASGKEDAPICLKLRLITGHLFIHFSHKALFFEIFKPAKIAALSF